MPERKPAPAASEIHFLRALADGWQPRDMPEMLQIQSLISRRWIVAVYRPNGGRYSRWQLRITDAGRKALDAHTEKEPHP